LNLYDTLHDDNKVTITIANILLIFESILFYSSVESTV
jgi:hypothetical protein